MVRWWCGLPSFHPTLLPCPPSSPKPPSLVVDVFRPQRGAQQPRGLFHSCASMNVPPPPPPPTHMDCVIRPNRGGPDASDGRDLEAVETRLGHSMRGRGGRGQEECHVLPAVQTAGILSRLYRSRSFACLQGRNRRYPPCANYVGSLTNEPGLGCPAPSTRKVQRTHRPQRGAHTQTGDKPVQNGSDPQNGVAACFRTCLANQNTSSLILLPASGEDCRRWQMGGAQGGTMQAAQAPGSAARSSGRPPLQAPPRHSACTRVPAPYRPIPPAPLPACAAARSTIVLSSEMLRGYE